MLISAILVNEGPKQKIKQSIKFRAELLSY